MFGEFLRCAAHPACQRNHCNAGADEQAVSFPTRGQIRSTVATGTKTSSQFSEGFSNDFMLENGEFSQAISISVVTYPFATILCYWPISNRERARCQSARLAKRPRSFSTNAIFEKHGVLEKLS
jgi:hypothetical protein